VALFNSLAGAAALADASIASSGSSPSESMPRMLSTSSMPPCSVDSVMTGMVRAGSRLADKLARRGLARRGGKL